MSTTPPFLTEEDWAELVRSVFDRQVIPVVGPELVTVLDDAGQRIPLTRWLAPRLAEQLKLPDARRFSTLNDAACAFLLAGGDRLKIYKGLRLLLQDTSFEPPPALLRLAEITDFDLFITSTFDPLLVLALEKARPGFARSRDVLAYDTKPAARFPDPLPASFVYHILGKLDTYPDFAVWEEDYMEYLCHLLEQSREEALGGLFRQLRRRHLLLLGAPYSDWIVRFFLRAARGRRLTEQRENHATETIADHHANLGEPTVFFFNHIAKATRIVDGDPSTFVEELARRWHVRRDLSGSGQDFLSHMADEMPRGAVFISYSHDDKAVATRLAEVLSTANIPVWLDKERLRVGENYERSLEHAVRDACSFFISVISAATEADATRYVHKERAWAANRFQEGFVFYLPVVLAGTVDPKFEPPCFAKIHREQLSADGRPDEEFVQRLRGFVDKWRTSGRSRT
jgi:hypothetical protein